MSQTATQQIRLAEQQGLLMQISDEFDELFPNDAGIRR